MRDLKTRSYLQYLVLVNVFFLSATSLTLSGCGGENMFEPLQKKSDSEKGQSALANGDYDGAISALEKRLQDHPDDSEAKSMLATSYAKKAGVDTFKIAGQIAASSNGGNADFQSIAAALPAGSQANIDTLEKAVAVLNSIPVGERTTEQNFQLALSQASLAATIAKKSAGSENGEIDKNKVDQISDADAIKMVESLKGASSALGSAGDSNSDSAAKLGSVSSKIDAQPGSNDAERLRNFLKN